MKVLAVHPGPLMYTKIFLRLEPLGLELVAAAVSQAGHDVRLIDLQVETHKRLFQAVDDWQPGRDRLLVQLPGERAGDRRPGQADASTAARQLHLRRRPQRLLHRRASCSSTRDGRHRLRAQGRGRGAVAELLEAVEHDRERSHAGARRRHPGRRGPAAALRREPRRSHPGPRPRSGIAASTSSACSTRARRSSSRAAARGTARSAAPGRSTAGATGVGQPGAAVEDLASHPRAGRLHRRRRRVHPGRARHRDRRGDRAARDQEALLPRDPRRRAAAQQGSLPVLEDAGPRSTCSSASRRSTRRG